MDPIITTAPTNDGTGRAYGFDLFASRMQTSDARITGWASYTWGPRRSRCLRTALRV